MRAQLRDASQRLLSLYGDTPTSATSSATPSSGAMFTPEVGARPPPTTPASSASSIAEEERLVHMEALERAATTLNEEREQLHRTATAAARREARRAETAELVAQVSVPSDHLTI